MTIKELKKFLKKFPDDMEILNGRYSDYEIIQADEWSVVSAVDMGHYVMRSHPTMKSESKAKEKQYLALAGN